MHTYAYTEILSVNNYLHMHNTNACLLDNLTKRRQMGSQTSLLAVSPHKTVVKLTHWKWKHASFTYEQFTWYCIWNILELKCNKHSERDFTNSYNIYQHLCWSWNNIPINQQIWVFLQSFVKFRFTTSVLLFTYYFPLILGITYRVMFRG